MVGVFPPHNKKVSKPPATTIAGYKYKDTSSLMLSLPVTSNRVTL